MKLLSEKMAWLWANRLHLFVFLTVFGSTPIVHARMVAQGVPDSFALWLAIASIDAIIVMAGTWDVTGVVIAAVLFIALTLIVLDVYPQLSPALFSLAAFLGTVGSVYMRWEAAQARKLELRDRVGDRVKVNSAGDVDWTRYKGYSVDRLRAEFGLSWGNARALKKLLNTGAAIPQGWVLQHRLEPSGQTDRGVAPS